MSHNKPQSKGFTLIELLVSITIFTIMTGIVLAKYNTYNTNAPFANASEDIVLALRQAQVYGAGSKGNTVSCGTGNQFECSYGVYFSTSVAEKNGLTIFVDTNKDRIFTPGTDSVVERIRWINSISISSLSCPGSVGTCSSVISVTFRRPNPDAFIDDTVPSPSNSYESASIALTNAYSGKTAVVTISKAGQISLQ